MSGKLAASKSWNDLTAEEKLSYLRLRSVPRPLDANNDLQLVEYAYRLVNVTPRQGKTARALNMLKLLRELPDTVNPVVECGVWTGFNAVLMCERLKGSHYVGLDSFKGLEPGAEEMGFIHAANHPGAFAKDPAFARNNLSEYSADVLVGHIPEDLCMLPKMNYRFVHVDVDCYAPTKAAIEYCLPRLMPGGILLCDDLNWPGARQACEEIGGFELLGPEQAYWRNS